MATLFVLAAIPCAAHDTWLLPRSEQLVDGKPALFDLTSGMSFPQLESPIKKDRITHGGWRRDSASGSFDGRTEEASSLAIQVTPTGQGTAVVFLSLGPKEIDLDAEEVAHYLDEIGASEGLRRDWEQAGDDATFHETYTKHAKAFVRVGDGGEDLTCLRQIGFPIELVPQRDPTSLSVGDDIVVKAVRGGDDELESFAVGFVCGETGETELRRTNESGMVAFTITDSGWWMVRATELRRKSDGTFQSDFITMTFFVEGD
jgi:uncharacterized GH25 family protein